MGYFSELDIDQQEMEGVDSMNNKSDGLHKKYIVKRVDRKKIKEGCIVLEWTDPIARKGIEAFSKAAREAGFKCLADDLDSRLWDYKKDDSIHDN